MNYKVISIPRFDNQAKRLVKKYPSLKYELARLFESLESNPRLGLHIGHDCYKIRVAISSKNKGKSSGSRVVTHLHVAQNTVYLLSIFDKSEQTDISDRELMDLLKLIVKQIQ